MRLEDVRNLKKEARKQFQSSSFVPILGKLLGKIREMTVTLGVGWVPGSQGGDDDYWLTARIRTPFPNPHMEKRIRAILKEVTRDHFDLRYTGPVYALAGPAPQSAGPRLMIGSSISHIKTVGGTLGFFARSTLPNDATRGFVSANHVIANLGDLFKENPVVSPAGTDREIGELVRFTSLRGGGEKCTDAAFAKLNDGVSVDRSSLPEGRKLIDTVVVAEKTTRVMKLGMASHFTQGTVTSFDQDTFSTRYRFGKVNFEDQIEVESADERPFAIGGDSGALVHNDAGHALGLLFAATEAGLVYVNPIQHVLSELHVKIDVEP